MGSHANSGRHPSSVYELYSPFLRTVGRVISFSGRSKFQWGNVRFPNISKTLAVCLSSERCPCSAGPARKRAHPESGKHTSDPKQVTNRSGPQSYSSSILTIHTAYTHLRGSVINEELARGVCAVTRSTQHFCGWPESGRCRQ